MLKLNASEKPAWRLSENTFVIKMSEAKLFLCAETIPSFERGIWQKRFIFYSLAFGSNRMRKHGTFLVGERMCSTEDADGLGRSHMTRKQVMRRLGILGFNPAIVESESVDALSSALRSNGAADAQMVLALIISKAASSNPKRLALFSKAFRSERMVELASTWPIPVQSRDYFFWQDNNFAGADMESRQEVRRTLGCFGFDPRVVDTTFPANV